MQLTVKEVAKVTPDSVVVTFEKPEDDFAYVSGQYITVKVPVNSEEERRAYSLCSSPTQDEFPAIGVKRVKGGKVSNFINDNIKAGDKIDILEPMGNFKFTPEEHAQRSIILIGGGSGMTPLFSIAKTALAEEKASMVTLINVNLSEQHSLFAKEIKALKSEYSTRFRVLDHYTEEKVLKKKGLFKKVEEERGVPTAKTLKANLKELSIEGSDDNQVYLCGPGGLMDISKEALVSIGVDAKSIHRESFVADASAANEDAKSFEGTAEVTVKIMGEEHVIQVKDASILQTGLDAGVEMPFSCQSGLCTACMGKCTEGKVEMEFSDGLLPEQVEQGYVLTCVGHPKTAKVTIEF